MADAISIQELIDARTDAKTLEEAVNGDAVTTVLSRLGETYPTLSNALNQIDSKLDSADTQIKQGITNLFENGGLPATPFATKALMTASALINGKYAQVTDDAANNGLYVKTAGAWVKSTYDPVTIAKADATTKADAAKNEALSQVNSKIEIDETNTRDIIDEKDANGVSVRRVTKDGKHYFIGLGGDLETELNRSATQDVNSDNIFEQRDSSGIITLKQDKDGDLHAVKIGNVTQAILDLQSKEVDESSIGINLEAAHLAGKYADYTLAENMDSFSHTDYLLTPTEVNAAGIFPYQLLNVRIPALNRIGKYKYLLIFEGRETENDFGRNSLGIVTLDIDPITFAVSKSNMQSLHTSFTDEDGKLRTFMNGCAVKLSSGKIVCLYVRRYERNDHQLYMRTSVDDGATWSDFTDITYVRGDTNWNVLCPCSKGLVKRYGQHKGRVVFPLWTTGVAYNPSQFRAGYIYSDDDGLTWELGEFSEYPTGNEVQCAEDLNGDMLFNIRLEHRDPPRVLSRLSDKTKEYTEVTTNKSLGGEAIMSGLIQGENQYDYTAAKFQISTCRLASRNELLIHTSYDDGSTWRTHLLPSTVNKGVAYSCIENISASHKFVLWEADGVNNFKYAVISLNNLIEVQ